MAYDGPQPNVQGTSALKSKILHLAQTSVFQVKVRPPKKVLDFLRHEGRGPDLTDDS